MTIPRPGSIELAAAIAAWLPAQRWFAAKHHDVGLVRIEQRIPLDALAPDGERADRPEARVEAEHVIVSVGPYGEQPTQYQVPIGYRTRLPEQLADAGLPGDFTPIPYDGLRDPAITARYLHGIATAADVGPIRFHPDGFPVHGFDGPSRMLGVEQSNTSVVYGDELLIKFFRHIEPGINPDIELLTALTRARCPNIAPLQGWIEAELPAGRAALAMASQFVPNASEGWSMALTSVRDLMAEADLHADEVGTDFADESERLGAAVAGVHAALADTFGTGTANVSETVLPSIRTNLEVAIGVVPELADYRDAILTVYADAAALGTTAVQRVHGDLHLGQTLRSPQRWLLIDFEGEPLRPLVNRRNPDSRLRDIAGMLRSFHYAGHQALGEHGVANVAQRRFRATEWVQRNAKAFCAGYQSVSGEDPNDQAPLLRAYQLDKAVYEATYEARHRPDWLHLPMQAIAELTASLRTAPWPYPHADDTMPGL